VTATPGPEAAASTASAAPGEGVMGERNGADSESRRDGGSFERN
jgi:hypothetical protein